jgi:hypothetical protein
MLTNPCWRAPAKRGNIELLKLVGSHAHHGVHRRPPAALAWAKIRLVTLDLDQLADTGMEAATFVRMQFEMLEVDLSRP